LEAYLWTYLKHLWIFEAYLWTYLKHLRDLFESISVDLFEAYLWTLAPEAYLWTYLKHVVDLFGSISVDTGSISMDLFGSICGPC
jgi:hypothetical protein